MEISLEQLEILLYEQRKLTAEKLLSQTYSFNTQSTESKLMSMEIDKSIFMEIALKAPLPEDVQVLKRYGN